MQSKNVNVSGTNNLSERKCEQTNLKNEIPTKKKDFNPGLRIPGSNWEKFKNLVAETASKEQNFSDAQVKKRKYRKHKYNSTGEPGLQYLDVNQVMKYIFYYLCCLINYVITMFCASKQHISNNDTTEDKKYIEPSKGLTKAIAMDCEMVGIGNGQDSMIARVSIVNRNGICVYDKYVKPTEEVRDYRTAVSGIRPDHLKNGEDFKVVQKEVSDILKSRVLIGHALHNDLAVLYLSHPKRHMRDTSRYKFFRKVTKGNTPSLKKLASEFLGVEIQSGEHNSIEDARTAMQLYQLFKKQWEREIRNKR